MYSYIWFIRTRVYTHIQSVSANLFKMSRTFVLFTELCPDRGTGIIPDTSCSMSYIQWNGNEDMLRYYAEYLKNPIYTNIFSLDITRQFSEEVADRHCKEQSQNYKYAKYYSNCNGPCKIKGYFQTVHKKENTDMFMKQWFHTEHPFMKDSAFIPIFNLFAYYTHRC